MEKFKHVGITLTNHNSIQEEIKSSLKCYCVVLRIVCVCVVLCTVCVRMCTGVLPPGVNPIAVNKYISYHIKSGNACYHSGRIFRLPVGYTKTQRLRYIEL